MATDFHEPTRAFFRGQYRKGEDDCGNRCSREHPAPTMDDLPGFAARMLDEHVDVYGAQDSGDDSELIKDHKAAANPGGGNFRDVHWSNNGCSTDADSADYAPCNILRKCSGNPDAERRQRKARSTGVEGAFETEPVSDAAGGCRTE